MKNERMLIKECYLNFSLLLNFAIVESQWLGSSQYWEIVVIDTLLLICDSYVNIFCTNLFLDIGSNDSMITIFDISLNELLELWYSFGCWDTLLRQAWVPEKDFQAVVL